MILLNYSLDELKEIISGMGFPAFRANQLYRWLYKGKGFDEMSNLPADLKKAVSEIYETGLPRTVSIQRSKDGTRKYLFQLHDGNLIESVFMRHDYGNTVCISTQCGCAMGCAFCASTKGGLIRNLSAGEIVGQVLSVNSDSEQRISNVVYMGIGEPFANYDNVVKSLYLLNAKEGINIGMRNISISTCGLAPQILRFAEEKLEVNLCISLHCSSDSKRDILMPVNRRYSLNELINAVIKYQDSCGRRVSFEYILISGFNNSASDADNLKNLLKNVKSHINLIPYNDTNSADFKTPSNKEIEAFMKMLSDRGLNVTIRRSMGRDIDGACGQLRAKKMGIV